MPQPLDPKKYPELVKYSENQIQTAVSSLQKKYPDMTEQQCLLNLEMDLEEIQLKFGG